MDFDAVLEELGELGRYQVTTYLLVCLPVLFGSANGLSYVFTAGVPTYRCFVPGCDNASHPRYEEEWLPDAIPGVPHAGRYIPEQCLRYQREVNASLCPHNVTAVAVETCDRWVYAEGEWTIVGEWDITCAENQWKLSLVGTCHFAGIFVGTVLSGFLADRFGRKLVFISCILVMSLTGIAQAVSPDYYTFQVFVFINALGTAGVYPLAFIIGVELVGPRRREMGAIVLNYFYALGEAGVALVAWATASWASLQLLVSAPAAAFVFYYWLIPESVRWLLATQRRGKAGSIIRHAADVNGVVLSERLLAAFQPPPQGDAKDADADAVDAPDTLAVLKAVCRSRKLVVRSLNLFFIWATNAFVYYGLSVNAASMGGDKFTNFALVSLVEIPGYTLAWLALERGRRRALAASLLLCGLTCLGAAFVPADMAWAQVVLFLAGKLGITAAFGVVFVYTAELYPTGVRSAGVGASSTVARLGAMVAPFAPLLGQYMASLPFMVFGAFSIVACLLCLPLPETLGSKLPDTIDDVERL